MTEREISLLTSRLLEVYNLLNTKDFVPGEVKGILLYVFCKVSKHEKIRIPLHKIGDFLKNGAFRDAWLMLSYQVYWSSERPDMELMEAIKSADLDVAVEEVRSILSFDSSDLDVKEKQRLAAEELEKNPRTLFFCLPPSLKKIVLDRAFYVRKSS